MAAPQYRSSTAAALDAADGLIDGKYYGRPIVETSGVRTYAGTGGYYPRYTSTSDCCSPVGTYRSYYGGSRLVQPYRSSTALNLDAADGVIDGRYYGRPIVETSGYPLQRGYPLSGSVTRYGRYYDDSNVVYGSSYGGVYKSGLSSSVGRRYIPGYERSRIYGTGLAGAVTTESAYDGYSRPVYRSNTALALDAADGVIDGRYYGRPIVETSAVAEAPLRRYGSTVAERLDAADGVIDGRYFGRPIVEAPLRRYGSSVAERLDAADGVIDGRYFGRPIVEAPVRRYAGSSVAERLDAADGVIDGKYYGRRIVQV
eukprot:EG_transcript_14763